MAKPTSLSPDLLKPATTLPAAAIAPRGAVSTLSEPAISPAKVPMQIRIAATVRQSIKVDAAKLGFGTESDFMVACYKFYMQHNKAGG